MPSLRHVAPLLLAVAACGGDDGGLDSDAKPVVEQYATIVRQSYADSITKAKALDAAIDAFVAAPSAPGLEAAKTAWIAARAPYRETEVYRFYDGPIDAPAEDLEPLLNSWPLDEGYIDSVEGDTETDSSLIYDTSITLDADTLIAENGKDGEENIATGYHAIEFLLWGQDFRADGPGNRPYTDFVDGAESTRPHADRRRTYLSVVSKLLIADLETVAAHWDPAAGDFGKTFEADRIKALGYMLRGMGALAGAELSGERMRTAWENGEQNDEHSCFSDTTHDDLIGNLQGIQNVYLGKYGSLDGAGLDDLVKDRNAALDTKMKTQLDAALAALRAIPQPFDRAIVDVDVNGDDGPGRKAVEAGFKAVEALAPTVVEIGQALDGISVDTTVE